MNIEQLILNGKGSIVDVRTYEEFAAAHAEGAINIPLQEIPHRIDELKTLPSPLILCCASGNRSGMAERFITQQGIECYNAGSWLDINYQQSKTTQSH
ncbi:MAG: rhodanese-like domain-containing protein [Chitinophagaceae bacterium]|nr:rhodanese-like domain-containing protein [Chitinophagaceae bacterium]